jgi:hypothetical protein
VFPRDKIETQRGLGGSAGLGYFPGMGGFISAMFAEIGARRRRLRASLGDRGQAIVEFLVLGGLVLGSLGLFLRPWMAAVAPWGFALPFVFLIGFCLIEARRQIAVRAYKVRAPQANAEEDRIELDALLKKLRREDGYDEEDLAKARATFESNTNARWQVRSEQADARVAAAGYDRNVALWSFGCALAGAAAFVIAFTSPPPAQPEEDWTPPRDAVVIEMDP